MVLTSAPNLVLFFPTKPDNQKSFFSRSDEPIEYFSAGDKETI
jgi:hypothetical protein